MKFAGVGDIDIKILGYNFGAMNFELLKISVTRIRKLQVWIGTDLSLSNKHQKHQCLSLQIILTNLPWNLTILLFRNLTIHDTSIQMGNSWRVIWKKAFFNRARLHEIRSELKQVWDLTSGFDFGQCETQFGAVK